jgi:coenzyme PQQ biosynthesis protein PqqD
MPPHVFDSDDQRKPRLVAFARLQRDRLTGNEVLLYPEGAMELADSAVEILRLCDGQKTVTEILALLQEEFDAEPEVLAADVCEFLHDLQQRGLLES